MSYRLLHRVFFKHAKAIFWNNNRKINTVKYHQQQLNPQPNIQTANLANEVRGSNNLIRFSRRLFIDNVLNRVTNPVSSALRAEATKKFAFGDSLPFFSIVGCSLASGNGVLSKEDEMEGICWEIREAVTNYQSKLESKILDKKVGEDIALNNLKVGPPIAKGCNAVVYAAAFKNQQAQNEFKPNLTTSSSSSFGEIGEIASVDSSLLSPSTSLPRFSQNFGGSVDNLRQMSSSSWSNLSALSSFVAPQQTRLLSVSESSDRGERKVKFNELVETRARSRMSSTSEGFEESNEKSSDDASIYHYPWALKMMFNYEIQSNAMAILRAMHKETIPARCRLDAADAENWEKTLMEQTITLPPHPNIVLMPGFFCDQIPNLQFSRDLYPSALPSRLNPSGYGRNMSLFVLMKRYDCNLREYLDTDIDMRVRVILFAQLLEAVAHLNSSGIAHRDLKSDNILIDTSSDALPLLVLSDFGCCLADKKNGLRLPYPSCETGKDGNQALMAPEIITKEPSRFAVLNYTKSDLWACGSIAYEIFGYPNPFYNAPGDSIGFPKGLLNETYDESMLPELGEEVPMVVKKLIENILQRSPGRRLSCDIAANVLELYLWAPSSWIKFGRNPTSNEILQWLLTLTTKVLCEGGLGGGNAEYMMKNRRTYTEYILISTFLSRAKLRSIRQALNWIQSL